MTLAARSHRGTPPGRTSVPASTPAATPRRAPSRPPTGPPGSHGAKAGPSVGEMVLAVALQRVCSPGPKCDLVEFLDGCVPRASCLRAGAFTGQAFHRLAQQVTDE